MSNKRLTSVADDLSHILQWLAVCLSVLGALALIRCLGAALDERWFASGIHAVVALSFAYWARDTWTRRAKYRTNYRERSVR